MTIVAIVAIVIIGAIGVIEWYYLSQHSLGNEVQGVLLFLLQWGWQGGVAGGWLLSWEGRRRHAGLIALLQGVDASHGALVEVEYQCNEEDADGH